MDVLLSDLRARVILASAARRPLVIAGGNTKGFYGHAVASSNVLDLAPYRGIVDYQPSELVLTALAGTRLADIEDAVAERGQMLAFDPPHFGEGATLGGCVAAALAGPRRASSGAVRDFVLGVRMLDGRGRVLRFGGQVMKNVAGYDVSRLMAGSLGTLGVILDVSIKVLPRPADERTLRFALDQGPALERLAQWAGRPLPVSASAWAREGDDGALTVRLSGSVPALDAACRQLGGERLDDLDAQRWWRGLRDHTHPFLTARPLWRVSVPATTPPLDLGPTLLEWGGAQRWVYGAQPPAAIRAAAAAAGGHATLFRPLSSAQADEIGVFHPLAAGLAAVHRRLKNEFDPAGIFNPGRMYPGL